MRLVVEETRSMMMRKRESFATNAGGMVERGRAIGKGEIVEYLVKRKQISVFNNVL